MAETGRLFLLRLVGTDASPVGAMWARRADRDERVHLFIVIPLMETKGPIAAHTIVGDIKRELNAAINDPFAEFGESDVKLIGPSDRLARGLLDWYQHSTDDRAVFTSSSFGGLAFDGAYIYPATMFAPAATSPSA